MARSHLVPVPKQLTAATCQRRKQRACLPKPAGEQIQDPLPNGVLVIVRRSTIVSALAPPTIQSNRAEPWPATVDLVASEVSDCAAIVVLGTVATNSDNAATNPRRTAFGGSIDIKSLTTLFGENPRI